jgi:hypothetical protein
VACPIAAERSAFFEWITTAGYEPVSIASLDMVGRDANARPIEALIADVSLVPAKDFARVVKMLGPNRPLVLVGQSKDCIEAVPRDATWMNRPVTRNNFELSLALALAEGRPARRAPRRIVPELLSTVDGVSSKIVDVSTEGVRLEINGASPSVLPPYFTLRVPGFGVNTKVKRVWVATPKQGTTWCGGIIDGKASTATMWNKFFQNAPTGTSQIENIRVV